MSRVNASEATLLSAAFAIGAYRDLSDAEREAVDRAIDALKNPNSNATDRVKALELLGSVLTQQSSTDAEDQALNDEISEFWESLRGEWNAFWSELAPKARDGAERAKTAVKEGLEGASKAIDEHTAGARDFLNEGLTQADRLLKDANTLVKDSAQRANALISDGVTRVFAAWGAFTAPTASQENTSGNAASGSDDVKNPSSGAKSSATKRKSAVAKGTGAKKTAKKIGTKRK